MLTEMLALSLPSEQDSLPGERQSGCKQGKPEGMPLAVLRAVTAEAAAPAG